MADRVAVYFGTRKVYPMMTPALKSMLAHTYVDRVYFFIEDDAFPDMLPDIVRIRNVSGQQYFKYNSPNYNTFFSYMVLLRAALPFMLPDEDKVLSIDNDTLVRRDIGSLFDTDISGHYYAAVQERYSIHGKVYFNNGVSLMNLRKLRDDCVAEQIIHNLNMYKYRWAEQDAFNDLCRGHILNLPPHYNCAPNIIDGSDPSTCSIRHYCGVPAKQQYDNDAAQYRTMTWKEVFRRQEMNAV